MKLWIIHSVNNVPRTIQKRMKKKTKMISMEIKTKSALGSVASREMTRMEKATQ